MNHIAWNFSAINKQMASIAWWCSLILWHPHPWSWQGIRLILNLKSSSPQLIKDPLAGGCICVTSCQVRWAKSSVFLNKVSQGRLWDVSSVGHRCCQGQPKAIHNEHALFSAAVLMKQLKTKPTGHLFWAPALLEPESLVLVTILSQMFWQNTKPSFTRKLGPGLLSRIWRESSKSLCHSHPPTIKRRKDGNSVCANSGQCQPTFFGWYCWNIAGNPTQNIDLYNQKTSPSLAFCSKWISFQVLISMHDIIIYKRPYHLNMTSRGFLKEPNPVLSLTLSQPNKCKYISSHNHGHFADIHIFVIGNGNSNPQRQWHRWVDGGDLQQTSRLQKGLGCNYSNWHGVLR